MSFTDRLTALTAAVPVKCKTCSALAEMNEDDRAGFADAIRAGLPASVLARTLVETLREDYASQTTVAETTVRGHVRDKHDPR